MRNAKNAKNGDGGGEDKKEMGLGHNKRPLEQKHKPNGDCEGLSDAGWSLSPM